MSLLLLFRPASRFAAGGIAADGAGYVKKREKGEGPRYIYVPPRLKPEPEPLQPIIEAEPVDVPEAIDLPAEAAERAVKVAPNVSIEAVTRVAGALQITPDAPLGLDLMDKFTSALRAMEADFQVRQQIERARNEEIRSLVLEMIRQQEEDDQLLLLLI